MFKLENRKVIIFAGNKQIVDRYARENHLDVAYSVTDVDYLRGNFATYEFNAIDTVIWVTPCGFIRSDYVKLMLYAAQFEINVVEAPESWKEVNLLEQWGTLQ